MNEKEAEIIENLVKTIENLLKVLKVHEERITRLEKKKGLFG